MGEGDARRDEREDAKSGGEAEAEEERWRRMKAEHSEARGEQSWRSIGRDGFL